MKQDFRNKGAISCLMRYRLLFWYLRAEFPRIAARGGRYSVSSLTNKTKSPNMSTQTLSIICRSFFVVLLPVLFLASEASAGTITVQVGQNGMTFTPQTVSIAPGDTVNWFWHGTPGYYNNYHSVTAGTPAVPTPNIFDSGVHQFPYLYSHTFTSAGNFPYFCQVHTTMMTGSVVVAGGTPGTLGNISTRLRVETGDNVLIGGFIITGTQPKRAILRAIGPSLSSFFPGALADPFLELRDSSGVLIASNDDWRSDQEAEIIATGIPPSNDLESAIVATLPANNSAYTAIVRGFDNGTGIGVVEAYDLDQSVDSKLANISTRGFVQTGDDVMIGGLIVLGQDPLRVIVRAIGPSLTVSGALGDPTLELHDGNGALIAFNDDWRTDQEAEIIATTIPPTNDLESAIVRDLAPGAYTAIVRGVNNATGVALVEVYGLN
jgi:plastocyanin